MIKQYYSNLPTKLRDDTPLLKTKNRNNEYERTQHMRKINNKENPWESTKQPYINNNEYEGRKSGAVKFSDDATLQTRNAAEIYHKLIAFKDAKNINYQETGEKLPSL